MDILFPCNVVVRLPRSEWTEKAPSGGYYPKWGDETLVRNKEELAEFVRTHKWDCIPYAWNCVRSAHDGEIFVRQSEGLVNITSMTWED